MATTIRVGKFQRTVPLCFRLGHEDTRWHVYPNRPRPVIYVQPLPGGCVYELGVGEWFKTPCAPCGGPEIDPVEHGIDVQSAAIQIERLVGSYG